MVEVAVRAPVLGSGFCPLFKLRISRDYML